MSEKYEVIESSEVEQIPDGKEMVAVGKQEETGITENYLNQLDFVAKNVERLLEAKNKIWQATLKIAKEGDWCIFGSGDKETVCLTGPGSERIASTLGVSFKNWSSKKEEWEDDKGRAYRWWFEATASFGGREVKAIGRASSRDKFFGRVKGEWKELSEIAEDNIKMAAFRGAMKEGVRILFGLRNIPKEEFLRAGIKLINTSGGYNFSKPAEQKTINPPVTSPKKEEFPSEDEVKAMFPNATVVSNVCSKCGKDVKEKVASFSSSKFGKILCFDCQKG